MALTKAPDPASGAFLTSLYAMHGVGQRLDALVDLVGRDGLIAQTYEVSRVAGRSEEDITGLDQHAMLGGLLRECLRRNMSW